MLDAETLMRQAGYTAGDWLSQAETAIENMHLYIKDENAKARIISAFMLSAAIDQLTMTYRSCEEEKIKNR